MDSYVEAFQSEGASLVMLAKGNRSPAVTEACRDHGGFYLGSIGGPAAILAKENIRKVEVLEYPELGWRRSGESKSWTSPPSSSWTTRETTSTPEVGGVYSHHQDRPVRSGPVCTTMDARTGTPTRWPG